MFDQLPSMDAAVEVPDQAEAPDRAEVEDRESVLAQALSTLGPVDRVAVQMYVIDCVPAAEIAKIVGLPNAKAVYNRVYRALAALRGNLASRGLTKGDV